MNTEKDFMNQVRHCAKEFIEREYPDEAPYFDIAWETFKKAIQSKNIGRDRGLTIGDLKKPSVRDSNESFGLGRRSTITAPRVIRAFHILFAMMQRKESKTSENLKQEMLHLLSQENFSSEFSMKIVDFFMEKKSDQ